MRRRRRPLLRTAALAGGGAALYHAGKKNEANAGHEQDQDAAIQGAYQQPAAAPAPVMPAAPSGGMSESAINQLKELGSLHDQGVLTDEEFAAQKKKILAG